MKITPTRDELFRLARILDEKGMTKQADQITQSMVRTAQYPQYTAPPAYMGQQVNRDIYSPNPIFQTGPFGALGNSPLGIGTGTVAGNERGYMPSTMGEGGAQLGGMWNAFAPPQNSQMSLDQYGRGLLGDRRVGPTMADLSNYAIQQATDQYGRYNPAAADAGTRFWTGGPSGEETQGQALGSYLSGSPAGPAGAPGEFGRPQFSTGNMQDRSTMEAYNPVTNGTLSAELGQQAGQTQIETQNPYQQAVSSYNSLIAKGDPRAQQVGSQAMQIYNNMTPEQQQQMVQHYGGQASAAPAAPAPRAPAPVAPAPTAPPAQTLPPAQAPQTYQSQGTNPIPPTQSSGVYNQGLKQKSPASLPKAGAPVLGKNQ